MKKEIKMFRYKWLIYTVLLVGILGCNDLDKNPLDALSAGTFWETEGDAKLSLTGVYSTVGGNDWWSHGTIITMDLASDNGYDKKNEEAFRDLIHQNLTSNNPKPQGMWDNNYRKIAAANNFLENIETVEMDGGAKAGMIAEVRFIRAYQYFWLSQFFGGVPLITNVLTINEANNIPRNSKEEVVNFVLKELTEALNDLPETRSASEKGRITKGAALAIKGRLPMAQKNWSEAAQSYKAIIDMGVHNIYPNYNELFIDGEGENSDEIILSTQYIENDLSRGIRDLIPQQYGGFSVFGVHHNLVDAYLMEDGQSKEDSPLYDPQNPLINRDPRLYETVFLPGLTQFRGRVYQAHPDSASSGDTVPQQGSNGYTIKKWVDEGFEGGFNNYGGNIPIIRYSEVLLSYLESKLEAGDNIDQNLLDETINQVRGRPSVNLPPVTVTNPNQLMEILRRERRVELAFEGLRLWDLIRWGIAEEVLTRKFFGMKLTDNPENYNSFPVNEEGHFINFENRFTNKNNLWPIPQRELDINPNLVQNPGY